MRDQFDDLRRVLLAKNSKPISQVQIWLQARIAARIEELFGEIEAGEQELEAARKDLETCRRAVLKAAVTGELTSEWRERNAPERDRRRSTRPHPRRASCSLGASGAGETRLTR